MSLIELSGQDKSFSGEVQFINSSRQKLILARALDYEILNMCKISNHKKKNDLFILFRHLKDSFEEKRYKMHAFPSMKASVWLIYAFDTNCFSFGLCQKYTSETDDLKHLKSLLIWNAQTLILENSTFRMR